MDKDNKRVLHYIPGFNYGGIESVVNNIYKKIDKKKIIFDFLIETNVDNQMLKKFEKNGSKIYKIDKLSKKNLFTYSEQIRNIFKENKYDIVHSHCYLKGYFVLKEAKKANVDMRIYHVHTSKEEKMKHQIPSYVLRKFQLLYATHYFACSDKAAKFVFSKKSIREGKVTYIENGIENDKFIYSQESRDKIRKELNLEDKLVLGHVGRFVKAKNHKFIIETFNNVYKKNVNSRLLLVGTGPLEEEVKKYVKQLGIEEQVHFMGERSDINEILCGLDIFLLPSLYEGLPVVIVEAQYNGLRCLVSDKVTQQVAISDQISYITIDNVEEWEKNVLDNQQHVRESLVTLTTDKFNNNKVAKKLQNIYLLRK